MVHQNVPYAIVTVSREFGSGGGDIAALLARQLGWRLVDRDLVQRVAEQLGVPEEEVAERDERVAGIGERVSAFLADAFPEMLLPPPPETAVDHDMVQRRIEATLREAAEVPPVIVVGHGGQCIFARRPGTLHVRVRAPFDERVRRVRERLEMDSAAARARILEVDEEREEYMRRSYGIDVADPGHYDLILNTGRMSMEEAATAVVALIVSSRGRDKGGDRDGDGT